ncbi:hypothetical protein D3C85_863120 [compost metagenome]
MKRILLLLMCTVTLGLASCKKDTIVQETIPGRTYYVEIESSDWVRNPNGSYSYTWNNNAIDKIAFDSDAIIVYFSHPVDGNTDIALPYTFNDEIASYQVSIGKIKFDMQSKSNISTTPRPPVKIFVKVVVIPSDPA